MLFALAFGYKRSRSLYAAADAAATQAREYS